MVWPLKKLSDVCNLQNGFAFKSKDYVDSSNVLNIRMSNIRPDGSFNPDHNPRFLPDSYAEEYPSFLLAEGDLVIAMTDMAGAPKILGLPTLVNNLNGRRFLLNQRVGKLFDFSNEIYISYLRYYLSSPIIKEYYKNKGTGGLQINISKKDVLSADIPLPSIPEQKRIVAILDQAFAEIDKARANAEQNLKNARELFESYLQQVFSQRGEGWWSGKLSELCQIKPPKKEAKELLTSDELVSFVPMKAMGIRRKDLDLSQNRKLKEVAGSYTYFADNDVLLAKITPCFENGKLGLARGLTNGIGFGSSEYIVFRCSDCINPDFLYHYLSRQTFINEGKKLMSGAVGHKRVSKDFIENYEIFYPSIQEQSIIVSKIDMLVSNLTEIENIYQRKLVSLDELKKSILQKAFTGELTQSNHDAAA